MFLVKEEAGITHWLKGLEFRERYLKELSVKEASEDLDKLRSLIEEHNRVTLVFAAKATEQNIAVALKGFILKGRL